MIDQWQNCYDEGWTGLIVPESFSHPAKFSRGLIHRIYLHAKEMGWIEKGSWVLDPFGGVSLGGLDALSMGLNWIGVELEEKFVKLGEQNIELWHRQLSGWPNLGTARIIQGDSRQLVDIFKSKADIVVSSPNFPTDQPCPSQTKAKKNYHAFTRGDGTKRDHEMRTIGNLANMPEGKFDAVVSSPNFPEQNHSKGWSKEYQENFIASHNQKHPKRIGKKNVNKQKEYFEMPESPGQLGSMKEGNIDCVISSPPYAESLKPETEEQTARKQIRIAKSKSIYDGRKLEVPSPGKAGLGGGYGTNPQNLGSMKEGSFDIAISSPPYEDCVKTGEGPGATTKKRLNPKSSSQSYYSRSDKNLGNSSGDTFWSASKEIIQQCYDMLKPNGHAIWVTKNYIKNGKVVSFSDRWLALCESIGFKLVCRHHAMLKKEYGQTHWINEQIKSIKERKSFFRRNAEDKSAAAKFWGRIDVSIQNEYVEKARLLVSVKPTEKKIIQKAQTLLWKDFLKPVEEIETRIDFEDILCLEKI